MSNSLHRDFFISFNSADLAYAQAIDAALRMAGFTTYYHPRDLTAGGNIAIWMDDALMNSAQTLALYSPPYTSDKAVWSKAERYATWWQDPGSDKRKLIPVLLDDTKLSPLIAPIKYIDVRDKTIADAAAYVVGQLNAPEEREPRDIWRRSQPLPQVFHAAYRPNPNFTGRFEALESLHRSLRKGTNAAITAVAGMGGIGKTTLAAEYCHRFGGLYGGVWWIRAEQESGMLQDIAALGGRISLQQSGNLETDARTCLDHLATQTEPWLLVYDSAPNPDAVRKWLPLGSVRCIITSRFTEFGDVAPVTRLDEWSVDVTVDYLLDRTKRNDAAGAAKLAECLGGLPLAAEQAAAYLANHVAVSFDEYVVDLARLIKRKRDAGMEGDYPDTVYAAFEKSLVAVEKLESGHTALNIVRLCAFLSPEGVDIALLMAPSSGKVLPDGLAPAVADKLARADALAALASFSLLRQEVSPFGLVLVYHRLLLEVVRDWMGEENRVRWGTAAAVLVSAVFPSDPDEAPSGWPVCAQLMPHIGTINAYAPKFGAANSAQGRLLNRGCLYLAARGNREGALVLAHQSVDWSRRNSQTRDDLARALTNLCIQCANLKQLDEAEAAAREATGLLEDRPNSEDSSLSNALNSLAGVRWQLNDFAEAERLLLRSLNIDETLFGTSSSRYGEKLANIGVLHCIWSRATGDASHLVKAEKEETQALGIILSNHGTRHPFAAQVRKNLAVVREQQKDKIAASNECEMAVATMLSLGLGDSPLTADYIEFLISYWTSCGKREAVARLEHGDWSGLVPAIEQIEAKHRAWVAEYPEIRHFGPPSAITGATA